MSIEESNISKQNKLQASRMNGRLFRNNVGLFYTRTGIPVKCGLAVGSGDDIGWQKITITPEMVGRTVAVFLSVESKTPTGRVRPEQIEWRDCVKQAGGLAFIARSADEYEQHIHDYLHG